MCLWWSQEGDGSGGAAEVSCSDSGPTSSRSATGPCFPCNRFLSFGGENRQGSLPAKREFKEGVKMEDLDLGNRQSVQLNVPQAMQLQSRDELQRRG